MRQRALRSLVTCAAMLAVLAAPLTSAAQTTQGPGGRGRGPLPPLGPATEPTPPRTETRHNAFLEIARGGNIDLLFVGDSITDWWGQPQRGLPVWTEYFGSMNAANFGIAGDTTQGVLWRLRNGELEGFSAKLIVHMLGTNNLRRNDNDDIVAGNRVIVEEFRKRQPQATVLLLGIFPRGAEAATPLRAAIHEINGKLAALADNEHVFYMDIGNQFLAVDGTLPADVMPDGLHPNERGYRLWAEAIIDRVNALMDP